MIRITKIIDRKKIFDYLSYPIVCKVELNNRENNLKNPNVCKIYLYLDTQVKNSNIERLQTIFGSCYKFSKELSNEHNKTYLSSICSQKELNWLSETQINRLVEIEKEENINLSIPKFFFDLIDEYKD